jgi:hypothetical protein
MKNNQDRAVNPADQCLAASFRHPTVQFAPLVAMILFVPDGVCYETLTQHQMLSHARQLKASGGTGDTAKESVSARDVPITVGRKPRRF